MIESILQHVRSNIIEVLERQGIVYLFSSLAVSLQESGCDRRIAVRKRSADNVLDRQALSVRRHLLSGGGGGQRILGRRDYVEVQGELLAEPMVQYNGNAFGRSLCQPETVPGRGPDHHVSKSGIQRSLALSVSRI